MVESYTGVRRAGTAAAARPPPGARSPRGNEGAACRPARASAEQLHDTLVSRFPPNPFVQRLLAKAQECDHVRTQPGAGTVALPPRPAGRSWSGSPTSPLSPSPTWWSSWRTRWDTPWISTKIPSGCREVHGMHWLDVPDEVEIAAFVRRVLVAQGAQDPHQPRRLPENDRGAHRRRRPPGDQGKPPVLPLSPRPAACRRQGGLPTAPGLLLSLFSPPGWRLWPAPRRGVSGKVTPPSRGEIPPARPPRSTGGASPSRR